MPLINTEAEHSGRPTAASADGMVPTVDSFLDFFNGTFRETFNALVTSDGATVTMTLERDGGGDLTMNFGPGQAPFDCTLATPSGKAELTLTAGTDSAPATNHVYILESDRILRTDTEWPDPDVQHARVALLDVQSAATVQAMGGVYGNNNINDHQSDTATGQGHLAHMLDWMRHRGAQWHDGCQLTIREDDPDLWVVIAAGSIAQVHHHTFAALDSEAGDPILVFNWSGDAWHAITSLNEITHDSTGTLIGNNKWYKATVAGVANKSGELSPMLLLLPSGTYNTQAEALADVDRKASFVLPASMTLEAPLAFFVASVVVQHQATKTVLGEIVDIRDPNILLAGGGGGAGDVLGPSSSADDAIWTSDGTTGNLLQDSGATITAAGITVPGLVHTWGASEVASITHVFSQAAATGTFSWVGASDRFEFPDDILIQSNEKVFFRQIENFIHSDGVGTLLIEADTLVTIGKAGHIDLGDGTLRQLRPQTDEKIDLGSQSLRFNDGFLSGILRAEGGVRVAYDDSDGTSPPTDAELDAIWGGPGTVGSGWLGVQHDAGGATGFRIIGSDGTNWYHSAAFTQIAL